MKTFNINEYRKKETYLKKRRFLMNAILKALKGDEPINDNKIKIDEKMVTDAIKLLKANPEFIKMLK